MVSVATILSCDRAAVLAACRYASVLSRLYEIQSGTCQATPADGKATAHINHIKAHDDH